MKAETIIEAARIASENHSNDHRARLAFRCGYLDSSIYELCSLLDAAEKVMQAQKKMIEHLEKGVSAGL